MNFDEGATTLEKTKQLVQITTIEHLQILNAMTLIKGCQNTAGMHNPNCLLLTGQSGTGKSTLIANYLRTRLSTHGILAINIPIRATLQSFIHSLYQKLGVNAEKVASINDAVHLAKVIKENEIDLIILDNFERVMDSNNNKVNDDVLNLLKEINEASQVPIVGVGLPICTMIVQQNPMLGKLFSFQFEIHPFKDEVNEIKELKRFLQNINKQLPFKNGLNYENEKFLSHLIQLSNGLADKIILFITTAANIALKNERNCISEEDFAEAYHSLFSKEHG